jgi:hypothetical protein
MREGLARELPEAVRAVAWTRTHVRLSSEPVLWAAVSGIGTSFLVTAVARTVVGLTGQAVETLRSPLPFPLFPLVTVAGDAAGVAVALGVGGTVALALYLAYIALGTASAIPGLITFCERAGGQLGFPDLDRCTAMGFLVSLWPQLVGIGLGILVARAITTRGDGVNPLLRIAGGYAIALFVVGVLWSWTVAQTTSALTSGLTIAAGIVAAAVAAGVIAAQLPRSVRSAAVVAGISLLPWVALQLPYALRSVGGPELSGEYLGSMLVAVAVQPVAAAFLVLSAAVAARRRFIPRDAA